MAEISHITTRTKRSKRVGDPMPPVFTTFNVGQRVILETCMATDHGTIIERYEMTMDVAAELAHGLTAAVAAAINHVPLPIFEREQVCSAIIQPYRGAERTRCARPLGHHLGEHADAETLSRSAPVLTR